MFSLAVLSVMVALPLDVVKAVSIAFWVNTFLGGSNEGVSSMAMQQGGLGLVSTMLIISAPPMAAAFFQGTMGNFTAFSQFGGAAGSQPGARGTGSPPVDRTATTSAERSDVVAPAQVLQPYQTGGGKQTVTTNEVKTTEASRLGNARPCTTFTVPGVVLPPPPSKCLAIAWGDTTYRGGGRPTLGEATNDAMKSCNDATANCKIVYADCSLPVWVE